MWVFIQHGYHDPKPLLSLNCCCMYLKAFWLSDLCTGKGDVIDPTIQESHILCSSSWLLPKPAPPSQADWRLWKIALTNSLHLLCAGYQLAHPLGPWFPLTAPVGWYFELVSERLWHIDNSHWKIFSSIPQCTHTWLFHPNGTCSKGPD